MSQSNCLDIWKQDIFAYYMNNNVNTEDWPKGMRENICLTILPRCVPCSGCNKTPIDGLTVNSEEILWFYFQDVGS